MPSTQRAYAGAMYGLELDGVRAGSIRSATGGSASSDVVEEKVGADHVVKKHLAGVKYDDIVVDCGTAMSKSFYSWISDTFDFKSARKDGSVVTTDYNLNEVSRLNFFHALIREVAFPALDASSKDAAKLTVKFAPEYTRFVKASGKASPMEKVDSSVQKKWLPSNFRLKIDGVDCTYVNKIDALVFEQKLVDNAVGELRDYEKQPAYLEIPDLIVTVAESHAGDFVAWHQDFVINGNNGDAHEKNGTLDFLAPNLKDILFTIGFSHLGIFKLAAAPSQAGSESIRRLTASMYCEQMSFKTFVGAESFAAGTSPAAAAAGGSDSSSGAVTGGAAPATVFVGDEEPPLVVVSGANGPLLTQDIPDRFTRIRRTM
jgi:phage tail-like protein